MTLRNSLFGAVHLAKNANPRKYSYSEYGNGFDACGFFSMSDGSGLVQNVTISWLDGSFSVHADSRTKCILVLGDDITIPEEAEYSINFSQQ